MAAIPGLKRNTSGEWVGSNNKEEPGFLCSISNVALADAASRNYDDRNCMP